MDGNKKSIYTYNAYNILEREKMVNIFRVYPNGVNKGRRCLNDYLVSDRMIDLMEPSGIYYVIEW